MNELFLVRIFAYSLLPLLLATGHMLLDSQARTRARRIELVLMYLLAISVGANGIGGAFGHLFLSDLVAEGIGWPTGSPFQLEMGYANLLIGVLGLMAIGRRDGFRTAAIIAATIIGVGATIVHLQDIIAHGNLSPGNTVQNIGNLLDPILLIGLTWWTARAADPEADTFAFHRWQEQQQPIMGMTAAGIGIGFGIGWATGVLFWGTLIGALVGVGIGLVIRKRIAHE
ncbi:MAG: hypothetical protein GY943_34500, partial [Chloroflexi bacterium]|nr:hypothetical protein [Chloroflexota bacterium]